MNGEETNMKGSNGKEYVVLKTNGNGSMKITLTNFLQTVIIAALSILGWVLADSKKTLTAIDEKTDEMAIEQAIVRQELIENKEEHVEIKKLIQDIE